VSRRSGAISDVRGVRTNSTASATTIGTISRRAAVGSSSES
jgi:hypothetical protein